MLGISFVGWLLAEVAFGFGPSSFFDFAAQGPILK
jgi:hypothetical protein